MVTMPFAAIRPSMGPSLLVSHLRRVGATARVVYLNMLFAKLLGTADYGYVADRAPTQSLAGDWVFSAALFGERPSADRAYIAAFHERFGAYGPCDAPLSTLTVARGQADAFIESCLERVDWTAHDLIGFTSSFTQHAASLALARHIKARHPELLIAFGGANCEDEMGLTLHRAFPFVDFVCSGEADISFPKLITELMAGRDGHNIPGVVSRRENRSQVSTLVPERVRELDTLPHPDFDDFFAQLVNAYPNAQVPRRILMESSRGCWWGQKHHCTFCGLNGLAMTFRSKSPERVLDEITDLARRYSAEHIEMVDNILDMDYLTKLLPELADRRLQLELFYETKANLRKDQLRLLHAAGVTAIQPGIESFSTAVLRLMHKGTSAVQNVQLLKWCAEIGIEAAWNLLYGFPGENPNDYHEMAHLIDSISHLQPPHGVGPIRLDRFSPNFTNANELGLSNVRPDRSYRLIYDLPDEHLEGLAYYFEHDYADGRNPLDYVGETRAAVRRWHNGRGAHGLFTVDHGDHLAIWDFRPKAIQRLTILEGCERLVYLHCDQHRSHGSIEAHIAKSGKPDFALDPFLDRLLSSRLMLEVDNRHLSLAVRLPTPTSTDDGSRRSEALVF
jgi:ribosomal peptide maturation radical SAM protein 1